MPSHATLARTKTAKVASVNRLCLSLMAACARLPAFKAASRLGLNRYRLAAANASMPAKSKSFTISSRPYSVEMSGSNDGPAINR